MLNTGQIWRCKSAPACARMAEGGDRICSGCRPERACEFLAGLFVCTDPYLCFFLCPPAQLVANGFTLERLQHISSHVCTIVDPNCEKVYAASPKLMSSFGITEH